MHRISSLVVRLVAFLKKKYFSLRSQLLNAKQTVWCCRFSLSDAGAAVAQQLRDKGDAVCPNLASPDDTAAGHGEVSATLTSDPKESDTFSAATSVKRKTTAVRIRGHKNCHTSVRTVWQLSFICCPSQMLALLLCLQGVKVSDLSPETNSLEWNVSWFTSASST